MAEIPSGWKALTKELLSSGEGGPLPGLCILGAVDSGKSTLASYLLRELQRAHPLAGLIDGDPGQSVVGPPTTVGARLMEQGTTREEIYRFVGSTTPVRHLLQSAVGLRRLVDQLSGGDGSTYSGRSGPVPLIVDTPGFVSGGVAEEFQYNLLELLRPTGLILLGEEPGVERIAANFANERNMELRRLERSPAARERNQEERRRYRVRRYEEYFGNAEEGSVELAKIGLHGMIPDLSRGDSARNLLCALCDGRQNVASLVVAGDYDDGVLRYWGPPVDSAGIANLQFGTLRLDRATFREY